MVLIATKAGARGEPGGRGGCCDEGVVVRRPVTSMVFFYDMIPKLQCVMMLFISCRLPTPWDPHNYFNLGMTSLKSELFRASSLAPLIIQRFQVEPCMSVAYSSIASGSAWNPGGSLPSLSIFSKRMISSRLLAFLIMS